MKCIKCDGQLRQVLVSGVAVDQCDKCSGIWFDLGELDKVLAQPDVHALKNMVDNNEGHDALHAHCPRCGGEGEMVRVTSLKDHDVHIDTCSVCYGQWLDGGELERLKDSNPLDRIREFWRRSTR